VSPTTRRHLAAALVVVVLVLVLLVLLLLDDIDNLIRDTKVFDLGDAKRKRRER